MEDNTICIKNCPITWTVGNVRGKFSEYGTIEEVQLQPGTLDPSSSSTQCVIIEFESAEGAEAVLEELKDSVYDASIYHSSRAPLATTMETVVESPEEAYGCDGVQRIHCCNSNCTNQMILDTNVPCSRDVFGNRDSNVYCSDQCYNQYCVDNGKVDIYDKWIASLGRSGTGLLQNRRKALDNFIITVDMDGERSVRLEKLDESY